MRPVLAVLEAVQHRAGAILMERSRILQASALMLGALQTVGARAPPIRRYAMRKSGFATRGGPRGVSLGTDDLRAAAS